MEAVKTVLTEKGVVERRDMPKFNTFLKSLDYQASDAEMKIRHFFIQ